jgi:hypothetical protein
VKYKVTATVERDGELANVYSREFEFSESSWKVVGELGLAIERLVSPRDDDADARAALERYKERQPYIPYSVDPREVGHDELFIAGFEAGRE